MSTRQCFIFELEINWVFACVDEASEQLGGEYRKEHPKMLFLLLINQFSH